MFLVNSITKLLNDGYISENLMSSLIQIFIDAERLGTQNQFFEKFNIRHKILYLIENIMKTHHSLYIDKISEYATLKIAEATKMINNLMNDLTYLIDECIEKLSEIKNYQELIEDKEKFAKMDEETKQLENEKFSNNDRIVKSELQVEYLTYFRFLIAHEQFYKIFGINL
jgi:ubiquitin conjugation factor E4 B